MKRLLLAALLLLALASPQALAARIYGWELEFTNSKIFNASYGSESAQANKHNDAAREKWYRYMRDLCARRKDCRIKEIEDWVSWRKNDGEVVWSWEVASYRIVYGDGFWFQLSYDPGIVEVQMKPQSAAQFRKLAPRIQRDIFDTAAAVGLKPKAFGETHVHVGAQAAFGLDLMQIRNFLVDGVNHPEWTLLFADGLHNAPPLILLGPEKYEAFREIVAAVDRGEITDLDTFVKRIRKEVYDVTFDPSMVGEGYDPAQKFQQWNIERLRRKMKDGAKTIEHRAMPRPGGGEDVADLTALVDARIEYVLKKGRAKPIALRPFKSKLTRQEQVRRFKAYVTESGLDFDDYGRFLSRSCERYLVD